jgi:uncharacterized integral membrane protein (TIGR00698 family)
MQAPSIHTGRDESQQPAKKKLSFFSSLSEDARAICIGSLLIVFTLSAAFLVKDFRFTAPVYQWTEFNDLLSIVLPANNLLLIAGMGLVFLLLTAVTTVTSGGGIKKYMAGFSIIFLLAVFSLLIGGNRTMSHYGIEYVVFGLLAGLLLSNLFHLPAWLKEAARSEFFIKTGLILLGTSILFNDIVKAGLPGILQSVIVVLAVWFFALWLCRRLKVDDEFAVILASAVSICGVSAAIVASGAIKGDKRKLSYVTTLVLLVAVPMLIFLPWLARKFGISELVGGAWLGGTLDTTAAVVASGELLGHAAVKSATIVKFSQNVLIGVAAFFIAAWWALRKSEGNAGMEKPSLKLIWQRFPRFVIGFIGVSLIFSFLIPPGTVKHVEGMLTSLRTMWFALAFVSIGLEARFSELYKMEGGRPALAFIGAQLFNIIWTLLWAWLLFGGILFAAPEIK